MNKIHLSWLPIALLSVVSSRAIAQDISVPTAGSSPPASSGESAGGLTGAVQSDFDKRFYIAPLGSYVLTSDYRHQDNAYGGALVLGKSLFPHISAEIIGEYLHYKGKDVPPALKSTNLDCLTKNIPVLNGILQTPAGCLSSRGDTLNLTGGGVGVNAYLSPTNYGLFLHGDTQWAQHINYNVGAGLDLPLFTHAISLRAEALFHKEKYYRGEPMARLGVRIPFGSLPQPPVAAPEPPAEVVAPVEPPPPPPPAPPPCQTPNPGEPITMDGCKTGDTIVLRGVNFDFNKATLTLNAKGILDQVVTALTSRADIKVEVDGHTDGKGSVPYNQKLSERRAKSVKQYLVSKGIDAGRMTTKGFGKSMPIADNSTDEGRDLNRRVELKVTDASGPVGSAGSTEVPVSSGASDSNAPAAAAPADTAPSADSAPPP